MEFLKENAEYFEKKAFEALKEGAYSFVLYFTEQAIQLYVKYILVKEVGDYPKTHRFSILFKALNIVTDNAMEFYEEYSDVFDLIEDAYIAVRYLGRKYSTKSAERAIKLIEEFKKVFKQWLLTSR